MLKKVLILSLLISILSYLSFMGLYFYTSEPDFCMKCHNFAPYVDSWETSPHKDVKCLFCHEPPGPLGKLHSKARGLNYLYLYSTNKSSALIKAEYINDDNCFMCHVGDIKQYPDAVRLDNIGFNHLQSIEKDQSCLDCHNSIGHQNNIGVEKKIK